MTTLLITDQTAASKLVSSLKWEGRAPATAAS